MLNHFFWSTFGTLLHIPSYYATLQWSYPFSVRFYPPCHTIHDSFICLSYSQYSQFISAVHLDFNHLVAPIVRQQSPLITLYGEKTHCWWHERPFLLCSRLWLSSTYSSDISDHINFAPLSPAWLWCLSIHKNSSFSPAFAEITIAPYLVQMFDCFSWFNEGPHVLPEGISFQIHLLQNLLTITSISVHVWAVRCVILGAIGQSSACTKSLSRPLFLVLRFWCNTFLARLCNGHLYQVKLCLVDWHQIPLQLKKYIPIMLIRLRNLFQNMQYSRF